MGDIDLLHPPRELEQRRHKLKRLVQSPNSFFMDVKCPGCFNMCAPLSSNSPPGALRHAPCALLLTVTASAPLPPQHHRLQPCADRRHLQRLLDRALPAHWWQGATHRGLLLPQEGGVSAGRAGTSRAAALRHQVPRCTFNVAVCVCGSTLGIRPRVAGGVAQCQQGAGRPSLFPPGWR